MRRRATTSTATNALVASFIAVALTFLLTIGKAQAAGPVAPALTRSFCNVYLDTLCFSLRRGQHVDVSLPLDFLLYTVAINEKTTLSIYSGYNPKDVLEEKSTKACAEGLKVDRCEFAFTGSVLDLIYDAGGMSPIVHIHVNDVNPENRNAIQAAFEDFHPCKSKGISRQCTDDRPFKAVLEQVAPAKPM